MGAWLGQLSKEKLVNIDTTQLDYRLLLKSELASRTNQNPNYSLRAFARDLDLAPSRLSEVLNGKQGLSTQAAEKIAKTLGYFA